MSRRLLRFVVVLLVAGLLGTDGATRADEPQNELKVALGWLPPTLDPTVGSSASGDTVLGGVFEGLTRREAATGRCVPGQAESWEISEDGCRFVFRLRADARWTDESPVTANDFVRGWLHVLEPNSGADLPFLLHPVRHARAYSAYPPALERLQSDASKGAVPILERLAQLRAKHPERVPADSTAWKEVLSLLRSDEVSGALADATLLRLLSRAGGGLRASDVDVLRQALQDEMARMERELALARAHLGKDEGLFAKDERTLVVELTGFTPWFLATTARPLLSPRHAAAEADPVGFWDSGRRALISNGPFFVVMWKPKQKLRLVRNPSYWGVAEVRSTAVNVTVEDVASWRVQQFREGEVHWAPNLGSPDFLMTPGRSSNLYAEPQAATYFLRVNCTRPPFTDPRVRRALGLAIDRSALIRHAMQGAGLDTVHVVPPGLPGYVPPESLLGHDPVEGRRLLAEAGYPGGEGFPLVDYLTNMNDAHRRIAEHVAQVWEATLGIRTHLRVVEWQGYLERTKSLDYDVARSGWVFDYPDPQSALDMWKFGALDNRTGWGDARFDRLLRHAADVFGLLEGPESEQREVVRDAHDPQGLQAALDALRFAKPAERSRMAEALRLGLLREAESILVQEAFPVIPLYQYVAHGAIDPRVEGFHTRLVLPDGAEVPNVEAFHPLRDLFVRR